MLRYSFDAFRGARQYTAAERYIMKTIYEIFQFVGETELHIETLRQRLAKCPRFESYFFFKLIADSDT